MAAITPNMHVIRHLAMSVSVHEILCHSAVTAIETHATRFFSIFQTFATWAGDLLHEGLCSRDCHD